MRTKRCYRCGEEKPTGGFYRNRSARDGLSTYCKPCTKSANAKSRAKRVQRNKEKLWNYLSNNPCVDCGESDPVVLDLDHVRGEKEINIGEEVHNLAWPRIMKEIEKCEVRCANCHFRVTAIRANSIKYQILQEEAWTHTK